ncbi:unnamed protein product, partial [Allacma fusca]
MKFPQKLSRSTEIATSYKLHTNDIDDFRIPKRLHVYNCVPNEKTNPLLFQDLVKWGCEITRKSLDVRKIPNYHPIISKNMSLFVTNNYLFRKIPGQIWSLMKEGSVGNFLKLYNLAHLLAKTFKPVSTEKWEFSTSNMAELNQLMDSTDRYVFACDFDKIDWKLFISDFARGVYSYDKELVNSSRDLQGEHNVGFEGEAFENGKAMIYGITRVENLVTQTLDNGQDATSVGHIGVKFNVILSKKCPPQYR